MINRFHIWFSANYFIYATPFSTILKINIVQDVPPEGIVQTESIVYRGDPTVIHSTMNVPVVATEARKVNLTADDGSYSATGEIISSQTISSKTRTVETITVCIFSYNQI